jgi:tetratricopeptide (TPR) repeat protein
MMSKAHLLPGAFDFTSRATIRIVAFVAAVVLVGATFSAVFGKHIVIEPITVPHALEEDGYSGTVVSRLLLEEIQAIRQSGDTLRYLTGSDDPKERAIFRMEDDFATLASIQVPSSSMSLRSLTVMLRGFLGIPERTITGAITITRPGGPDKPPLYTITFFSGSGVSVKSQENADLRKAIRLSANSIAGQFAPVSLAAHHLKNHELSEVRRLADELTWKYPKEGLVLRGLYEINFCEVRRCKDEENKERIKDGIEYFKKALEEDPKFSEAYNAWGTALVRQGKDKHDEAIKKYEEALKLNPDNFLALRNRALVHKRNERYPEAIADYEKAIVLHLEDVDLFFDLGRAYEEVNDHKLAIKAYSGAIKLDSGYAMALNNRCYMRAAAGESSAIADCNDAVRLRADYQFLDSRAFAYLKLNELDKAIADYDRALAIQVQEWSLFGRGVAKRRKGDVADGDVDIAKALELDPKMDKRMEKLGVKP